MCLSCTICKVGVSVLSAADMRIAVPSSKELFPVNRGSVLVPRVRDAPSFVPHSTSKNYDPTFSQLTGGQPVCTLRPMFLQRMLQLKWPEVQSTFWGSVTTASQQLSADGNFSVGFSQDHHPTHLTEIPTSPGPPKMLFIKVTYALTCHRDRLLSW